MIVAARENILDRDAYDSASSSPVDDVDADVREPERKAAVPAAV